MKRNAKKSLYTLFAILVVIPIALTLAVIGWYRGQLGAVSHDQTKKMIEIKAGDAANTIAHRLAENGLIKNEWAFRFYVQQQQVASKLPEGVYYLAPSMGVLEIVSTIIKGEQSDIKVTLIEGWRNEEIADALSAKLGINATDFVKAANKDRGYLFPDTYLFNKKATVTDVVATLRDNFDKRVDDQITAQITAKKLTMAEAITLASIVERESHDSIPNERQLVASILYKRLKIGMPIQADATVQYALGYDKQQKKWWRVLSRAELQTDSPYNTYKSPGLPPGPICNPGLASIKAVATITDVPYLYYMHGKDGVIHPAKTLDEHNVNLAKYL